MPAAFAPVRRASGVIAGKSTTRIPMAKPAQWLLLCRCKRERGRDPSARLRCVGCDGQVIARRAAGVIDEVTACQLNPGAANCGRAFYPDEVMFTFRLVATMLLLMLPTPFIVTIVLRHHRVGGVNSQRLSRSVSNSR